MTNEIKNIPQLRFPNFDGDWEECKLEEISDKVTEKNKNNQFSETLTNSAEYGVISQRDFFDKDISNEKNLNGYYIVQEDDFVYNPRISNFAPVGPIKRNKLGRTGVMSPLYYVFRTRNIDVVFLDYYFETTGWHKFMKLNGDSGARADRFAIKDLIFKTMPIPYPIIEEQEKIGNFFSKLDRQIELEEQNLEKLEEQKKGYMQKIFSQELRFKDENGNDHPEWGENALGEITNITTGSLDANAMVANGKYKFFTCARETYQIDNYAFDTEALLISGNGANVGYIHHYKGKFNAYQRTYVLDRIETNIYFLKYYLEKNLIKRIYSEKRDGNTPYITRSTLYDMEINIPISNQEQQKIGDFFKKVDELIETQFSKVELLKERKKGFLQKMFV
ncbi:restriction endonuclease subunit S [Staphylococcus arlettae]|uniref:restriction endonuclease subunit S n=1 Tax=Staphylococcus arlettae TaxID=29378 RepID=UPI001E34F9D2|nr:restriction endonuclease subunit S [Staphylococcus arlettae]MCD8907577.1 restriction endonuclease subunit S [Staphylococcus arlettae]